MIRSRAHSGQGQAPLGTRRPPPPPAPTPSGGGFGRSHLAWAVAAAGVVAGLVYVTSSVLSMLLASAVLAWLFDRPVSALQARGRSREFGIALVTTGLFAVLVVIGLYVVPDAIRQIAALTTNLRPYFERAAVEFGPLVAQAEARFGVDLPVDVHELGQLAPEYLQKITPDVRAQIEAALATVASGGLSVVLSLLSLSLLPLFTFFLLRDWPDLVRFVADVVPPAARPTVGRLVTEIDARLIGWVRGQLTVAVVLGVVYSVGLWLSDIDLAVTIGLMGGVLFLVPYVGPLLTGVLAGGLCLLKFGVDVHLAIVVATFVVGQALEGTVLTPLLVGDRVGLHPMVVMVAIIVGGNLLGMVGIIIAVPVTAALAVVGAWGLEVWKQSRTYGGSG